jgi:hypothetical protein
MKEAIENYREKVDKKLIIRQRIFFVIIFILIILGGINVGKEEVSPLLSLSGFFIDKV